MQEESQQQEEAEAPPGVLDYAPPLQQRVGIPLLSFLFRGALYSILHYLSWFILAGSPRQQGSSLLGCLFLVLNLPLHIVRGLLRLWAMQSHLLSRLHWALIAQSLLYGFTIALLIHWLKRRQMRRL